MYNLILITKQAVNENDSIKFKKRQNIVIYIVRSIQMYEY